jgi:hypothetical protein
VRWHFFPSFHARASKKDPQSRPTALHRFASDTDTACHCSSFFMSRDVSGGSGVYSCGSPGSRPLPIDWCLERSQVQTRDCGLTFQACDWVDCYGVWSRQATSRGTNDACAAIGRDGPRLSHTTSREEIIVRATTNSDKRCGSQSHLLMLVTVVEEKPPAFDSSITAFMSSTSDMYLTI